VPWPVVAAILTVARFCEPSSELAHCDTWYRRTALGRSVGVPVDQINDDRLYTGSTSSCPQEAIEKHLKERLGDLFDLKYELLLYDITSTTSRASAWVTAANAATRGTAGRIVRRCVSAWW